MYFNENECRKSLLILPNDSERSAGFVPGSRVRYCF